MADTAIVEHTELALASVVRDRALLYDSLVLVLAFGPCFACSCDQKVLTCLLVSSRRSFYIVPRPTELARATAGRARACCCCCCCCCCRWHAPSAAAAAAAPIPPGGPQPPGAKSEHTGARTSSCPRSARPSAHTTSERARSPLPALGQTICGSLSAGRSGDAQTAANHGQQAKGSRTTRAARQRKVRQRAPIRPRDGGRQKGACGGGERDWDGIFATPLAHLIPGGHLDGQHHHLRQKLVDRAPQTVAVAPDERLSRMGARGNRAELDEWGGVLGL